MNSLQRTARLVLTDSIEHDGITVTVESVRRVEFPDDRESAQTRHNKAVQRVQELLNGLNKG